MPAAVVTLMLLSLFPATGLAKRESELGIVTLDPLKSCFDVANFAGKCLISQSPGACYAGPTDPTAPWQCWNAEDEAKTDGDCTADPPGLAGACEFPQYGKRQEDSDLPDCLGIEGFNDQCTNLDQMWGACFKRNSATWWCLGDSMPAAEIERYRLGDCLVQPIESGGSVPFDGLCRFDPSSVHKKAETYSCETVTTFHAGKAETSCAEGKTAGACFSLENGVPWTCLDEKDPNCFTRPDPTGGLYDGYCAYKRANPENPADASGLPLRTTATTTGPTTAPVTTATVTTTSGVAGSGPCVLAAVLAPVLAVLLAASSGGGSR